MDKKLPLKLTQEQKDGLAKKESVAGKMKFLNEQGMARADIARTLSSVLGRQISYQWVKNVLDKVQ